MWLQSELVSNGLTRVYAPRRQTACLGELLVMERQARKERRGLWAELANAPFQAANADRLSKEIGKFRHIEGRVRRISRIRGRIYLNFGRDWRRDVTLLIPRDIARDWPREAMPIDRLKGTRVLFRGWVKNNNGPLIVLEHASYLEVRRHK